MWVDFDDFLDFGFLFFVFVVEVSFVEFVLFGLDWESVETAVVGGYDEFGHLLVVEDVVDGVLVELDFFDWLGIFGVGVVLGGFFEFAVVVLFVEFEFALGVRNLEIVRENL